MTTYSDISQPTTSHSDVGHGALLKCNNETILCNTEEWLCDGSVNMRSPILLTGLADSDGFFLVDSDGKRLFQGGTSGGTIVTIYTDISYT